MAGKDIFHSNVEFHEDASFSPPGPTARPTSGITIGEVKFEGSTKSLLLGNTSTTWDEIVVSLVGTSGVSITGTGGRLTAQADSTVVRTSSAQSIADTKIFTGRIDVSGGRFQTPSGTTLPVSDNQIGDQFYDSDDLIWYIYNGSSYVPAGGVTSITAGGGLSGGGSGPSVLLDVGAGNGITVNADDIEINLAAISGLEFNSTALQVKVDTTTASGTVASVIERAAAGLGIRIDDVTITSSGPAGALEVGVIGPANIGAPASQSVLETKFWPAHNQISLVNLKVNYGSIEVSDEVKSAASTLVQVTDLTSAKGVFVGYSENVPLKVRDSVTKDPLDELEDEIIGRLSSRGYLTEDAAITGVTVLGMFSGCPDSGTLFFDFSGQTLTWNSGTPVSVSAGEATDYYKIPGPTSDDYVLVEVVMASLPGSNTSITLTPITGFPDAALVNITGVTVLGLGPGVTGTATLAFTLPGSVPTLEWDGGSAVDVSVSGVYVLEGGAGPGNYIKVEVDSGSVPAGAESDNITPSDYYELQLTRREGQVEKAYKATNAHDVDFLFIEVFDLYAVPAHAILTGVAFGDTISSALSHNHDEKYPRVYKEDFIASSTWVATHGFNTDIVDVEVQDNLSPRNQLDTYTNIEITDGNTVTVTWPSPQTGRVIISAVSSTSSGGFGGAITGAGASTRVAVFSALDVLTSYSNFVYTGGTLSVPTCSTDYLIADVHLTLKEVAAPAATAAYGTLFTSSSDSNLYFKTSSGVLHQLTPPSSGSIDGSGAAGHLAYWVDADTLTSNANLNYQAGLLTVGAASGSARLTLASDGSTGIPIHAEVFDSSNSFKRYLLKQTTTTATPTEMFLNHPTNTLRMLIPADTTWSFKANIVARRTDASDESAAYVLEGCIDNNTGTTALVGSIFKFVKAEDDLLWDANVTADDVNDAMVITVTGAVGKSITWFCVVDIFQTSN